jgi:hypothetical protein
MPRKAQLVPQHRTWNLHSRKTFPAASAASPFVFPYLLYFLYLLYLLCFKRLPPGSTR